MISHETRSQTLKTVPTQFKRVPRPVSSRGAARLEFAAERFIGAKVNRFAADLIRSLPERILADPGDALAEVGWSHQRLLPDTSHFEVPRRPKRLTAQGLARWLGNMTSQLDGATDNAAQEDISVLGMEAARAEAVRIASEVQVTVTEVCERYGHRTAVACLQECLLQASQASKTLRRSEAALAADVEQFRKAERELRDNIEGQRQRRKPRFLRRGDRPLSAGMTAAQRADFLHRISKVEASFTACVSGFRDVFQSRVLRRLMGDANHTGLLEAIAQTLRQHLGVFEQLATSLPGGDGSHLREDPFFHRIQLIRSLDEPIGSVPENTLNRLYSGLMAQSGCTLEHAMEALWRPETALRIQDHLYLPTEYHRLPFGILREELIRWVHDYLGRPQGGSAANAGPSALDRLRTVNLGHPALESVVKTTLRLLVSRAAPYVAATTVANQDRKTVFSDHLFAHPSIRPILLRWLATAHCRVAIPLSEPEGSGPYDLETPNAIELVRFAFNIAVGSLTSFQLGVHANRKLAAEGQESASCLGADWTFEHRLLNDRPADRENDAVALVKALVTAGCIHTLAGDNTAATEDAASEDEAAFVPEKLDPTLAHLSCTRNVKVLWMPEDSLFAKKDSSSLRDHLRHLFPDVTHWGAVFGQLSIARTASDVVRILRAIGVLEVNEFSLVRLALKNLNERHAAWLEREGFIRVEIGAMKGLTRDELINRLIRNDWLYSCCTYLLTDAFAAGRIPAGALTPFARALALRLEHGA